MSRHEKIQVKSLRDQKQDCHTMKMERGEQPSLFIVKLDRMREDLKKLQHDATDEDFVQDVLGKLPESKDPQNMSACEVERKIIDGKTEDQSTKHGIDQLITDLEKVCQVKKKSKDSSRFGDGSVTVARDMCSNINPSLLFVS